MNWSDYEIEIFGFFRSAFPDANIRRNVSIDVHYSKIPRQIDILIEDYVAGNRFRTVVDGNEEIQLFPDFLVIPTSGHTRGHCVLLYKKLFLVHWRPPLVESNTKKSLGFGRCVLVFVVGANFFDGKIAEL